LLSIIDGVQVTFRRLPDHQRGWALVVRDDGVVYRMSGGPVTAELPHDLVHFTVERAFGMADGIWGAVAAGVVFRSMTHHSGRRRPHAAERSAALIRAHRDRLQRAELIGGFVERIATMPDATPARIRQFAQEQLATLPDGDVDLTVAAAAAVALREMAGRWRALPVGGELTLDWPARCRMDGPRSRRRPPLAPARPS
jgi:nucleotide-binding universal stress UspA family protein